MRRNAVVTMGAGLSLLLFVSGCERTSNIPTQPRNPVSQGDQIEISGMISQDALFSTDNSALNDSDPAIRGTVGGAIPWFWGRWIKNASRDITFDQIDDTTVQATITVKLSGELWVHVKNVSIDTVLFKPIEESIVHKARFVKFAGMDTSHVHWKLIAVSGLQGGTVNAGIAIRNVEFFIDTNTISISDPLGTFFSMVWGCGLWQCPFLRPDPAAGFKVQVTVSSTDPDSDIVVSHRPMWFAGGCGYHRDGMKLVSSVPNGDGTFTRVYESAWEGAYTGRFNVFIGAITRQSIYDYQAPFSSSLWGIPYVVNSR
jgi:hypothetical protein